MSNDKKYIHLKDVEAVEKRIKSLEDANTLTPAEKTELHELQDMHRRVTSRRDPQLEVDYSF